MVALASERVGLILVHGIGEQRRFEHLDQHLRPLVKALKKLPGVEATVEIAGAPAAANLAEQDTWRGGRQASVRVVVRQGARETEICVHEVWWADVNEPYSLMKRVRFWAWGLSIWNLPPRFKSKRLQARTQMVAVQPSNAMLRFARAKMLLTAVICATLAVCYSLSIGVLQRLFRFKTPPVLQTLVNYMSSIKLYNQSRRVGAGIPGADADFLDALGDPPRTSIRRRMIRTIADVACAGYDRWYVLGHSLGSVVAFNGLMEPAYAFPAYLDEERWTGLVGQKMAGPGPMTAPAPMTPARPVWLAPTDCAYRPRIFANFGGLLTYGSPLGKFGAIWPALVPFCLEPAFPLRAEWINVFDPTDPVSGPLDILNSFMPKPTRQLACCPPKSNLGYKASSIALLGHIKYLTSPVKNGLAWQVAEWLLGGAPPRVVEPLFYSGVDDRGRLSAAVLGRVALLGIQVLLVTLAAPALAAVVGAIWLSWLAPLASTINAIPCPRSPVQPIAGCRLGVNLWRAGALVLLIPIAALGLGLALRIFRKSDEHDFDITRRAAEGRQARAAGPPPPVQPIDLPDGL